MHLSVQPLRCYSHLKTGFFPPHSYIVSVLLAEPEGQPAIACMNVPISTYPTERMMASNLKTANFILNSAYY